MGGLCLKIESIDMREILHFLGWRGTPLEPELLSSMKRISAHVSSTLQPRAVMKTIPYQHDAEKTNMFDPLGCDVLQMLSDSHEIVLFAATLGADSERMLLREQAVSPADAVLLDAVLSAAIEAFCNEQEAMLRTQLAQNGLYLTDRFSPGYGDMPLEQTREICVVLGADRRIGLTVSQSGIMIPRKSVTAVMGVSRNQPAHRATGCAVCAMRESCMMRKPGTETCRYSEFLNGEDGQI